MMSLKSLHLKTLYSRNRKSRLRPSSGFSLSPSAASATCPGEPYPSKELGRLHRHMLAGIARDVVWRRGGDGSALKSGFLIRWLLLLLFFAEDGDTSTAALF